MTVKLNSSGERHLRSLINSGDYNTTSSWGFSGADGDALLGPKGDDWSRYASIHLAEDTAESDNTKARWKYPAGKAKGSGEEAFRSGLIAAKQRAAAEGATSIEDAAGRLVDLIDKKEGKSAKSEFDARVESLLANRPSNLRWEVNARAESLWRNGPHNASDAQDTICIMDTIGDGMFGGGCSAKSVMASLKSIGKKPVTVEINSPGGDLFEGFAIYNALRDHPRNVTVKVMGLAASAAAVVAMAGDKILMPRAGFMMIHNAWVMAMGNANDLRSIADSLDPFDNTIADIFKTRTGVGIRKVKEMLDAETWLGGTDAVDMGFADGYLPADQIPDAKNETLSGPQAAMREIDRLMAAAGAPRSIRRNLLKEFSGKPSAADDGKPSAAEPAALSGAARLRLSLSLLKLETGNENG